MRAALDHLAAVAGARRRIAILGDMAELGHLLVVGPQARAYGGTWFAGRDELLAGLRDLVRPDDAVLVKASRSMGLERVVEAIAP